MLTCGVSNLWCVKHVVCPTCGVSNLWCVKHVVCQTCGVSNLWCVQLVVCPTCGVSNLWCVQLVVCQTCTHRIILFPIISSHRTSTYFSDSALTLSWKCLHMMTVSSLISLVISTSSRNLLATNSNASSGHAYINE